MTGGADLGSGAARPRVTATVTVTLTELEELRDRLGNFVSYSDPDLSRFRVVSAADGQVEWTATDSYRLGRLSVGAADGEVTFGVPVRTLTLAWQMADRRDAEGVTFTVDGDPDRGVLRVDGVEVTFYAGLDDYPDVEDLVMRVNNVPGWAVTVAAEDLFAAIHGATLQSPWVDADDQESFVLHVDATAGRLRAVATWDGHDDTTAAVACTASRDARVGVNPKFLYDLASAAGEDVLTLHLPAHSGVPLWVDTDDGFLALLMPVRIGVESALPAFEAMLAELLGLHPENLELDADGDYPVTLPGEHFLYLSLIEGDCEAGTPPTVLAYAILTNERVDPTPELLTELNDLNHRVRFAHFYWAEGAVLVRDELLLSTLDAAELGRACHAIAALAARVGPMFEAVHGAA